MVGNLSEIGRQISGNSSNVLSNCLNLECKYRYYTVDVSVYSMENSGFIRVVATTPRKDPQPNISDLRDRSQSIFRPILTRIQKKKKKKKKKLPPPVEVWYTTPPPPDPPPTLFGGPLCERTERGRDMKISGIVYLDTADALKYVKI